MMPKLTDFVIVHANKHPMVKALKKVSFQNTTTSPTLPPPTKTIVKPKPLKSILKKPQYSNPNASSHENCNKEIEKLQEICTKQASLLVEQDKIIKRLTLCLAAKNGTTKS